MINAQLPGLSEKDQNILTVFNCIIEHDIISQSDVSAKTGLSAATVSRVLATLKAKNLIYKETAENNGVGRKSEIAHLNSKLSTLLQLNFFQHAINCYLCDLSGEVYDSCNIMLQSDITLPILKDLLIEAFERFTQSEYVQKSPLIAVGVSVPGVILHEEHKIIRIPDIFLFKDINVFELVEGIFHMPIIINNDARLAALGEYSLYEHQLKTLLYVGITQTGLGSGIVLDGKIYAGRHNFAGEIGEQLCSIKNFDDAPCENAGYMEKDSCIATMLNEISEVLKVGGAKALREIMQLNPTCPLNLKLIEKAYEAGDEDVSAVYLKSIKLWAMAIINSIYTLDPDIIILGEAITPERQTTYRLIMEYVSKALHFEPKIKISELGTKAHFIGGISVLREFVFNEILSIKAIE